MCVCYLEGGGRHAEITDSLIYFICKDTQPFTVVTGRGFKRFVKTLAPLYKLPGRNTVKDKICMKYEVMSEQFKSRLKTVEHITLTTDIWTETMNTKSFLGVTAHFIQGNEKNSAALGITELCNAHTGEYIASELKDLNKWEISLSKINAVVTDSGANIVKAISSLFGRNKHLPCLAHTLNLVAESTIKNTHGLGTLLDKVRAIVLHIKNSVSASDELRRIQINNGIQEGSIKKLKLDVKTRWNSTFYMCERFLELSTLISTILLQRPASPPMLTAQNLKCLWKLQTF